MRKFSVILLVVLLSACSSIKESQRALNSGNYDESIKIAVEKLRQNKVKKRNQEFIPILEDAYAKAVARDTERIHFLRADNNPTNIGEIYGIYQQLIQRQEMIRPLLPLGNAHFEFKNYTSQLVKAKNELVQQLYEDANSLCFNNRKVDYRMAYDYYSEIEKLMPNYRDVRNRMEEAHYKGTDFILVSVVNETQQLIPERLEDDLLDFNTYGLDMFWAVFDSKPVKDTYYDYGIELALQNIEFTPERIYEREIIKEKEVVDGVELLTDEDGNAVLDSLGNKIEVDKLITARCRVYEFRQHKSCRILAEVSYLDFSNNEVINRFPIDSHFVFENSYGDFEGDKRALDEDMLIITRGHRMRFPTNEQLVFDTGMDLKNQFKSIIATHRIGNMP